MPIYLEIENSQNDPEHSLRDDLMGISLLALLVAPWAIIGLTLYTFNVSFISNDLLFVCISTLLVALPKLFQLLASEHKEAPETLLLLK